MRLTTLAEASFAKYKKPTRKEIFLSKMEEIIPWKELSTAIELYYPKPKGSDRRPIGIKSAAK